MNKYRLAKKFGQAKGYIFMGDKLTNRELAEAIGWSPAKLHEKLHGLRSGNFHILGDYQIYKY